VFKDLAIKVLKMIVYFLVDSHRLLLSVTLLTHNEDHVVEIALKLFQCNVMRE